MQCFYPHYHPWRTRMPGHDVPHGTASDQWLMSQQKGYSNRSILIYWSSLISHHPGLLNWQMVARPFAGWVIALVRWQYLAGWHKVLQKAACPEWVSDVVCCCPTVRFMGVGINGGNGVASLNITPRKPLAKFLLSAPVAIWSVGLEVSNGPVPRGCHWPCTLAEVWQGPRVLYRKPISFPGLWAFCKATDLPTSMCSALPPACLQRSRRCIALGQEPFSSNSQRPRGEMPVRCDPELGASRCPGGSGFAWQAAWGWLFMDESGKRLFLHLRYPGISHLRPPLSPVKLWRSSEIRVLWEK